MSLRRISILVATAVLVAAPGALAAGVPKVPSYSGPVHKGDFKAKPSSIVYAMGGILQGRRKANHKAGSLHWSSWSATGGRGSGFNWVTSGAGGKYKLYPVKLHPFHPRRVAGHLIFTRMTVTYTGAKPSHSPKSSVWTVKHSGNDFFWNYS